MFLDWIGQLQLLQHDPQTNILGPLPLSIRRALISEITNYLQPGPGKIPPDPTIFSSPAHVKWYMEVLGQGFSLPLEDMEITSNDVSIYAQWLLEAPMRPAAVVNGGLEQEFYQIIFHQLSLLFQPRVAPGHSPSATAPTFRHPTTSNNNPSMGANPTPAGRPSSFNLGMLPVNPHTNMVPLPPTSAALSSSHHVSATAAAASNAAATNIKETLSQLIHRHIELCKKTLTILAMAGRRLDLSLDTWRVLLKVMLGISDYLLKEPMGDAAMPGIPNMSDELCEHLLRVLFELWLRSGIRDVEMWNILKECFMRWTHRPKAIQQWSATSLSLTNRILNLMYGSDEGSDSVHLTANGINVKLDLPSDFVYYAWHRILYLCPHPLQLPSHNFTLAILGYGPIVEALLSVRDNRPSAVELAALPDGNTILHMFGAYLFDACSTAPEADAELQRGCAEAFSILCKIFCRPQRPRPFLRTYIERFYAALTVGLKSDACLPTILLNCTELFATDLEGVRMLVPDFVSAIKLVLPKLQIDCKDFVAVEDLRLAAIKVLSTIMCLPNHFDKVELKPGWDWDMQCVSDNAAFMGEQEQIVTQLIRVLYVDQAQENMERPFTCLKFYILELLLMSLRTETSSYNMRYLLHLINVYVTEDVPFCPGLVGTVVKLIQEKILTMQMPSDVTLVAFDVLMDFVDLYDYVKRDSKNVARELVLALCRYVDTLIAGGKLAQTYPLIVQAYDCMMKWILASQWIIDDRDCYKAVISTLSKGITIFERETDSAGPTEAQPEKKKRRDTTFPPTKQLFQLPPRANSKSSATAANTSQPGSRTSSTVHKKEEVAVRMAAEYCMSQFINQLGKFPSWNNRILANGDGGTRLNDISYLKTRRSKPSNNEATTQNEDEIPESYDTVRYFLIDKRTVIALFDVESNEAKNVPAVIAVIRDTTGKYVWSIEARYKDPRRPSSVALTPDTETRPATETEQSAADDCKDGTIREISQQDIPTVEAVNEKDAIPKIDCLFEEGSDDWKVWKFVKTLAEKEQDAEAKALKYVRSKPLNRYQASPADANINKDSARGFRLLLSELGLLLPKNMTRITPMRVTKTLITEMETLDMRNERDCISITAYYALSGDTSWEELVEYPPPLSEQFLQLLNCLGWPVDMEKHEGFRGKLHPAICKTAPYYTDRTTEFLVNVPYLLHMPPEDDTVWDTFRSISSIHQTVTSDDHVCVVWIEDLVGYQSLAQRIKASSLPNANVMVYIFINPLKNSADGLYWIRIYIPPIGNSAASIMASQRLNENALIFGPLVDGIVVSRHALGSMLRNTAISAHQACRVVTDTYTRPYVMRKQFIEEIAHRHRTKLPLSEFYSEMFMGKDT